MSRRRQTMEDDDAVVDEVFDEDQDVGDDDDDNNEDVGYDDEEEGEEEGHFLEEDFVSSADEEQLYDAKDFLDDDEEADEDEDDEDEQIFLSLPPRPTAVDLAVTDSSFGPEMLPIDDDQFGDDEDARLRHYERIF